MAGRAQILPICRSKERGPGGLLRGSEQSCVQRFMEAHRKQCEPHKKDPQAIYWEPGFYLAGHPEIEKLNLPASKASDVKGRLDILGLD